MSSRASVGKRLKFSKHKCPWPSLYIWLKIKYHVIYYSFARCPRDRAHCFTGPLMPDTVLWAGFLTWSLLQSLLLDHSKRGSSVQCVSCFRVSEHTTRKCVTAPGSEGYRIRLGPGPGYRAWQSLALALMLCIVLCCIVLHCIVLYYIVFLL